MYRCVGVGEEVEVDEALEVMVSAEGITEVGGGAEVGIASAAMEAAVDGCEGWGESVEVLPRRLPFEGAFLTMLASLIECWGGAVVGVAA